MTMNKVMVDNVLAAIAALVADETANGNPATKFRNIGLICQHADSIRRLGISRVADAGTLIEGGVNEGVDDGFVGAEGYDMPVRPAFMNAHIRQAIAIPANPLATATDMIRDFADLQSKPKTLGAVEELNMLTGIRTDLAGLPGAHLDIIDRRIAAVLTKLDIETETTTHDDSSNVVSSELLRGHQARGRERILVRGDHDAADIEGTGSAGQAGDAGEKGGLARGIDQPERVEHAQGADREGREGAVETAQA